MAQRHQQVTAVTDVSRREVNKALAQNQIMELKKRFHFFSKKMNEKWAKYSAAQLEPLIIIVSIKGFNLIAYIRNFS